MDANLDIVQKMIDASGKKHYMAGPRQSAEILSVENELGVVFPNSFREFLARWGTLSIGSKEYYGLTNNRKGIPDCSWFTKALRDEIGFPEPLIVFLDEADGTEYICLDTSKEIGDGECSIAIWDNVEKEVSEHLDMIFSEFLLEDLEEYLK